MRTPNRQQNQSTETDGSEEERKSGSQDCTFALVPNPPLRGQVKVQFEGIEIQAKPTGQSVPEALKPASTDAEGD